MVSIEANFLYEFLVVFFCCINFCWTNYFLIFEGWFSLFGSRHGVIGEANIELDSIAVSSTTVHSNLCLSKLPKLVSPTFNGNYLGYNDFIKSFEISVDSTSLPDTQKFNDLKSFLKDAAADMIAGLELSTSN